MVNKSLLVLVYEVPTVVLEASVEKKKERYDFGRKVNRPGPVFLGKEVMHS